MVQNKLQQTKPSQDDEFAQTIQFFLALRDQDLAAMQKLVAQNAALLEAKTEWKMALGHHYWPLGSTALHLAAGAGSTKILAWLLSQSVDGQVPVQATDPSGMTPLHVAVVMGQPASTQLLIDHGIDVNILAGSAQTPLHIAAVRGNIQVAELLLQNGAEINRPDKEGRTAMDWAIVRNNGAMVDLLMAHGAQAPTDFSVSDRTLESAKTAEAPPPDEVLDIPSLLGRIITGTGEALDSKAPLALGSVTGVVESSSQPANPFLLTGLKIIDLLAPLVRGGQNGIFTPLSGVGHQVLIGEIMYAMHKLHRGHTVWLFLESDIRRAVDQKLIWRELGIDEQIVYVVGQREDSATDHQQTVATGLTVAEQLRRGGGDVLLLVDSQLAQVDGVLAYLRANAAVTPKSAITTLVYGSHTVGVLPEVYAGLDAVLTFDYTRAINRLYPAIDPVRSGSTLLEKGVVSPAHRQTATTVKRLLQRYADLRPPMDQHKLDADALWYIQDDPNLESDIVRARRLDRFLTQSFYSAEPWSAAVGQLLTLEETVAGCQAILDGTYDELPEEAFYFVGAIEEAVAKAQRERGS